MEPDTINCLAVGDPEAGKIPLLVTYTTNKYPEYMPSVFNNYAVTVMIRGEPYILSLYDTSGQEEYDKQRPLSYHKYIDVFLVCFSVACPSSFRNVEEKWGPEITRHCPNTPFLLVGTETDLREDPDTLNSLSSRNMEPISHEQGEKLANTLKAWKYVECSAQTQKGLKNVFDEAILATLDLPEPKKKSKDKKCMVM